MKNPKRVKNGPFVEDFCVKAGALRKSVRNSSNNMKIWEQICEEFGELKSTRIPDLSDTRWDFRYRLIKYSVFKKRTILNRSNDEKVCETGQKNVVAVHITILKPFSGISIF